MGTPRRAHAAALPMLVGEGIRLGPWHDADLDALARLHADPRAMRYWSTEAWAAEDQPRAEAYLDAIDAGAREGDLLQFSARQAPDGTAVGWVTLYRIDREHRRAEIGYLLDPALWGRGLGRRMLGLAIGHAIGTLGLHRIEADVDPRNLASCRLLESLGFQREGLLRERWRTGGELQDTAMYGLLAPDWRR
jgi:RimJ/RimL family protein N-acetyltransferase